MRFGLFIGAFKGTASPGVVGCHAREGASLRGALFGVSFLAGPALAGWLLTLLTTIQVVWVTAACSAVSALAVAMMPLALSAHVDAGQSSPMAGLVHIRRSRPLLSMLVLSLGSIVLVGPLLSIVLPAHFSSLSAPGGLGLSLSAYAVGTIIGSGVYGWLFAGRRWLAWVVAYALYVASGVLIATLHGFWLVGAGMLVAGLGSGLLQPITMVVLTEQVPDALRGRVFGTYSALAMVVSPIGLGGMALVLSQTSLGAGAWVLAAGWALLSAYAVLAPGLRDYIRPHATPEAQEDR